MATTTDKLPDVVKGAPIRPFRFPLPDWATVDTPVYLFFIRVQNPGEGVPAVGRIVWKYENDPGTDDGVYEVIDGVKYVVWSKPAEYTRTMLPSDLIPAGRYVARLYVGPLTGGTGLTASRSVPMQVKMPEDGKPLA